MLEIAIKQRVCFQIKADPKTTNSAKFHISSLNMRFLSMMRSSKNIPEFCFLSFKDNSMTKTDGILQVN